MPPVWATRSMRGGCSRRASGNVRARRRGQRMVPASARRQIPERVLQRPEPRLEVSPLIDALLIYGLAHLLGAGRAHAALRFVKLQAGGGKVQAHAVQDPLHLALEILDQLL